MKTKILALLLAFATTPIFAEVSGSVGVTSDYFFRGVSQTQGSSAVQGGVDASKNGFYAGAWASTVDFGTETEIEYDFYGGYAVALDDLAIDVGIIQYNYDGDVGSVEEYFVVMNYAWASFGFWFDQDNTNPDYSQITVSKDLGNKFTLALEVVSEESVELDLDERIAFTLGYTF